MTAIKLDGAALAQQNEIQLAARMAALDEYRHILATILVGDDPSSAIYVRMKCRACERIGLGTRTIHLPHETTTRELLDTLQALNADHAVVGILLQHPVPAHIDERQCFDHIAVEKDVDGVTCHGFGRLAMQVNTFASATPLGIARLLRHYEIPLAGKDALIIGRSAILGKPMAMMLLNDDATVTLCHSHTTDLPDKIARADLVIAALGKAQWVQGSWLKDGAVAIDAGYHIGGQGDMALHATDIERLSAYTPVPGGVGPMTINSLMFNTVSAAEKRSAH